MVSKVHRTKLDYLERRPTEPIYGPFDYGGLAEVAEYLGATKSQVQNWRNRFEDFPTPVVVLAMGPIYNLCKIRDWARDREKTGRLKINRR